MTLIADETPRARKEHQCEQCARTIGVGEVYRRQRGIWDGEPYVWKCCGQCYALVDALWNAGYENDEGGYPYMDDFDSWWDLHRQGLVWLRRHFLFTRQWRWRGRLMEYPEVTS